MSNPIDLSSTGPVRLAPLSQSTRPDRSLIAILLLAVLALGGTIALLPGSEEKAEGLLAEGRYTEAIETLSSLKDDRPLDTYESYMLFKLYLLTKQPDAAEVLLRQEPALQPENAWALRQLAQLYRETRDFTGEATALRQLYDTTPDLNDFTRLRALYRLTGDLTNEASLLAKAVEDGNASPGHVERLAYLLSGPQASKLSAIWLSPFSRFAPPTAPPSFTYGDLIAPTLTPIEQDIP